MSGPRGSFAPDNWEEKKTGRKRERFGSVRERILAVTQKKTKKGLLFKEEVGEIKTGKLREKGETLETTVGGT